MIKRTILIELQKWAESQHRKPLVLRGARQVGKTTAVKLFADNFDTYIYLNLELTEQKKLFEEADDFENLVESIFFSAKQIQNQGKTLIFIDEIQNSPQAVAQLRYFYENRPDLYIIAAGSLLETMLDTHISFPVGRVQFLKMHPMCFEEYLWALGEEALANAYQKIPAPQYTHTSLLQHFHHYSLIGGMPEVVQTYANTRDLLTLNQSYESLLIAYMEDVEKYAAKKNHPPIIRHTIQSAIPLAGSRIKFGGFGNSNYSAKDIREALTILEKAFLFQVIHPHTGLLPPVSPDTKKAPRLHLLDTGLINYFADIQQEIFQSKELEAVYSGRIAEHIIGQEIIAANNSPLHKLHFWVRDKKQSNAEVDYIISHNSKLYPVEVKSGKSGRLRSLHQYLDQCPHNIGLRLFSGKHSVENAKTLSGKEYKLINIPLYHGKFLERYIEAFT
jgi:predicted AAA+ superfamily ATPase